MDPIFLLAIVAALAIFLLLPNRLPTKVADLFHDEPAVLSHQDALTAGLDIAARFRPRGYLSEEELVANLAAIEAAAQEPLPLRCRNLRHARGVWLTRYRNATLRDLRDVRACAEQRARLAAHGL